MMDLQLAYRVWNFLTSRAGVHRVVGILLTTACATSASSVSAQSTGMSGQILTTGTRAGQYRLQPGDVLQFRVWPNQEASGEFPVESTGIVYLPLAGAVTVGGKTLEEVRSELRDLYRRAVQGATQPVVTVTALFPFSVTGGVVSGGLYDGRAGMTVSDAMNRAGGPRGDTRPGHVDVVHADGTTTRLAGDASELTSVLLRSQDHVVVPAPKRSLSLQTVASMAQLAIGIVTMLKLF
jgi:protein involved in polysaccharide export with SLBB domain